MPYRPASGAGARCALVATAAAALRLAVGCGGARDAQSPGNEGPPPTSIEIAELEIRTSGVDRFTSCPPAGDLGQGWIPPATSEGAHDPTLTERAVEDTLAPFRSCYRRGLLRDPSQDGRVAVVLQVAADGKVSQVDTTAACRLTEDVLQCMKDAARRLHFDHPAGGTAITVVIPVAFVPRSGTSNPPPTVVSSYTAAAYVAVESARPALHECERRARGAVESVVAQGTYALEIDRDGRVVKQHVDPWSGNQELLACAAAALGRVAFPQPPGGRASALVRLAFNPRSGTR